MAVLSKGTTYATGNQVTAAGLNALVDSATFASGAVDESTTTLSGGAIIVKDAGITMPKLATASNGEIPIGNGTGFTKATLTAGTNIGITNASGSVTVAFSGTLPIASGGTGAATASAARTALGIEAPTRCTATLTEGTNTYTDVAGMSVNVTTGATYTAEFVIPFSASAGVNTSVRITGTATASSLDGSYTVVGLASATGGVTSTSFPVDVTGTGGSPGTNNGVFRITITFVCNGSGTLKLQAKGSAADATIGKGTFMKLFAY